VYGAPETVVPVLLAVAAICSPEGRGRFRVPLGQVGDVTAALESAGVTVTVRARRHPVPVCDTDEFDDCIRLLTEMLGASPVTSSASPVTSSDVVPTSSDEVQPEELTA
jgi:hypothetical protein